MPCQPEILGLSEQELSKRQEADQKGILPVLKDGKEEHNQIWKEHQPGPTERYHEIAGIKEW